MNKLNLSYAQREASRCLLCYDPPCSKACPGNFNPGRIIRAVHFNNLKGASNILNSSSSNNEKCADYCSNNNSKCQRACLRGRLDRAIQIYNINQILTD